MRGPHLALIALCLAVYLPGLTALPPLDRDESRFAQASKQMMETGDYVQIRFRDGPRHKKPAGIHWLQAGVAAAAGGPDRAGIWAYRFPSVLGAIAAVLALYHLGTLLFGRAAGLLGAALMAATGALVAEANIAKTDAVLLATVIGAQLPLARAYLHGRGKLASPPGLWTALLFWGALGAGILIKGPIMPMVIGLTIVALGVADRNWAWLKSLRPLLGAAVTVAMVLPWGLAILFATDGQFYRESIGVDLIPKILGGVESHGFWPGFYLVLAPVTFWPATLFLLPAAWTAWTRRAEPAFRFLAAWAIPAWLVFELVPTKLPHYVMPAYPALALAAAAFVFAGGAAARPLLMKRLGRASMILWAIIGFTAALTIPLAPHVLGPGLSWWELALASLGSSLVMAGLYWAWAGRKHEAALAALGAAVVLYVTALQLAGPRLDNVFLSPRLAAAVDHLSGEAPRLPVASTGYAEPSLVFLLGTDTLLTPVSGIPDFWRAHPDGIVMVAQKRKLMKQFRSLVAASGLTVKPEVQVSGLGRTVILYRLDKGSHDPKDAGP